MRYRFIKDINWEPWRGCSAKGVTSLGKGVFGKIFAAWRLPGNYDPDEAELIGEKVERTIVAVRFLKVPT